MNITTFTNNGLSARFFAGITLLSLLLSAVPVAFFVAEAANTDAVGTVSAFVTPDPAPTFGEQVQVSFTGAGTLNLEDWEISDASSFSYVFSGVTLNSGDSYTICQTATDNSGCDDQWSGSDVWNNGGDTLTLTDENDDVVLTVVWSNTVQEGDTVTDSNTINYAPADPVADIPDDIDTSEETDGVQGVDFCDPAQKPGGKSIAQWHADNQFDGSSCFDYEVTDQCGSLDVQFTGNQTPYNYAFHYVIGNETPELANFEGDGQLPVNFNEDENGGSVDVTYYVTGAEKDYFTGSDVPNIWDGNGETVTIDTDCENDEIELEIPQQCSVVVDEIVVPADSSTGADSNVTLDNGRNYFAVVEGTYTFGNPKNGNERLADAEYSLDAGETDWVKELGSARPDVLDLFIDGNNPDFGTFRSDHTYGAFFSGTGAASNFAIQDNPHSDNSGELDVTIYECEPIEKPVCEIGENLLKNASFEEPKVTDNKNWFYTPIVDWVITALSDNEEQDGELHRGWEGNDAAHGEQYAELDSRESVKMSQTVDTVTGATYELKWAFAPRHSIDAEENQLSVLVDGAEVATEGPDTAPAGLASEDWTRSSYLFVADSDETTLSFADVGVSSDTFGTFLDDTALCFVREPEPEPKEPEICSEDGEVVSSTQGNKNNGNPVDASRSDVAGAENGVADYNNFFSKEPSWDTDDFYTLGINGELVYKFTDKIAVDQPGDDIAIWEITGGNSGQSNEKVDVYLSEDGISFELTEQITGDGKVDIADTTLSFVKYVKLVDQSNGVQGGNGDGYDLDAITIIEGSCEEPTPVSDQYADITMCKEDEQGNQLSGWQLALLGDTVASLAFAPTAATQSMEAIPAGDYVIKAESTYGYGNGGRFADARFSERKAGEVGFATSPFTPWREALEPNQGLAVQVEGDSTLWGSIFSPAHVYYGAFTQASLQDIDFSLYDNQYADNSGSIDLTLYQGFTGITGENGCVVFEDVPYGDYEVAELLQGGFENTSGLGSVVVDEDQETFTVVNNDLSFVPSCELDIYSDEMTLVKETNQTAKATYDGNDRWTADIANAIWVWATGEVEEPEEDETYTFVETFMVTNPSAGNLAIAHDNWLKLTINDTVIERDQNGYQDFQQYDEDILAALVSGENRIEMEVKNIGTDGSNYLQNPAGALFHIAVTGEGESCERTTQPAFSSLTIDNPAVDGTVLSGTTTFAATYKDYDTDEDEVFWAIRAGSCSGTDVVGNAPASPVPNASTFNPITGAFETTVDMSTWDNGDYCLVVNPREDEGAPNERETRTFTLQNADTQPQTYRISGVKWADDDGDGIYDEAGSESDSAEDTISGWVISLLQDGVVVATTTTDGTGEYSFDVESGVWTISEEQNSEWTQTGLYKYGEPVSLDGQESASCTFTVPEDGQAIDFYTCSFGNQENEDPIITPVDPEIETESGGGSGSTGTRVRRVDAPNPLVLGATTDAPQFCPFLTEFMQIGAENDQMEVMKLQLFLNVFKDTYGGTENPITGTFGSVTDANVKAFQEMYRSEVLDPWFERGIVPHDRPTGYVYKTTLWKINSIVCPDYAVEPDFTGESLDANVDNNVNDIVRD